MRRVLAAVVGCAVVGLFASPVHAAAPPGGDAPPEGREWVDVTTLPPVPGVHLQLADEQAQTDDSGRARFSRPRGLGEVAPALHVLDDSAPLTPRSRVRLARVYRATSIAPVVTFEVDFAVTLGFVDRAQATVAPATVGSLQLKSSVGEVRDIDAATTDTVWLMGQRVVPFGRELQVKNLYWTVQEAIVGGSNVINRSQQRFEPATTQDVSIELLFFTATFRGRDAFFGFTAGSAILLEYPDGHIERHSLGDDGVVVLDGLPRGQYLVTLLGPGKKVTQPVAITRDLFVDLKLFSFVDMGAIVGILLSGAAGLLLLGRRNVRRRARRASAAHAEDTERTPDGVAGDGMLVASGSGARR